MRIIITAASSTWQAVRQDAVLAVGDIMLTVEDNGYQGADPGTLASLSRNGKAAK